MSLISSPHTTSGSSTPLTGASGAIPLYLSWQSTYVQEGFGVILKSSHGAFDNGACYHDPNPNVHRCIQSGSRRSTALFGSENGVHWKQVGGPCQEDLCNGQSVLADRGSQQLLREHVKLIHKLRASSPLNFALTYKWPFHQGPPNYQTIDERPKNFESPSKKGLP